MADKPHRHTLDELCKLGEEIYHSEIKPKLSPEDDGKFVAIDVDRREYAMDEVDMVAVSKLTDRFPDAQSWLVRVGWPAAVTIGRGRFTILGSK